jgi:hypothetical protein
MLLVVTFKLPMIFGLYVEFETNFIRLRPCSVISNLLGEYPCVATVTYNNIITYIQNVSILL